jgi:hypothetical protein
MRHHVDWQSFTGLVNSSTLNTEAVDMPEVLVSSYQNKRCHISEENLYSHRCDNPKPRNDIDTWHKVLNVTR